jgi:chromosomal replication initiator protein
MIFYGMLKEKVNKMNVPNKEDLISKCISNNGNVESCGSSTYLEAIAEKINKNDVLDKDFKTKEVDDLYQKYHHENSIIYDDIMNYIAEHCDNTNIREMEGILSKVWFYASLTGKDFADMNDLKEAIKDYDIEEKQTVTYDTIIDCVCEYFNLKREELLGKKRNKEIVEPRQICMYIISQILDMPLLAIGQIFGRDHTTVIHARDKITQLIEENSRIKVAVNDIKSLATKK